MNAQAGKGSTRRPSFVTDEEYAANYDAIFRKSERQLESNLERSYGKTSPVPQACCTRCHKPATPGYEFCTYCGEADYPPVREAPASEGSPG